MYRLKYEPCKGYLHSAHTQLTNARENIADIKLQWNAQMSTESFTQKAFILPGGRIMCWSPM